MTMRFSLFYKLIIFFAIAFNIGLIGNLKASAEKVEVSGGGQCEGVVF